MTASRASRLAPVESVRSGIAGRLLGVAVDVGLLLGVLGAAWLVAPDVEGSRLEWLRQARAQAWAGAGWLAGGCAVLVPAWFWSRLGGTPGMLLAGCRVVDARRGRRIGAVRAVVRALSCAVSVASLGVGWLSQVWDRDGRTWHDHIAGTRVVAEDEAALGWDELLEGFD